MGKNQRGVESATSWDYGIKRLKEKWNRLRIIHRLFTSLIKHTRVTWDSNTNEVNAAEEVWNHFYTINKWEYKTFRKKEFRHYEILLEIFCGTLATGGLYNASTEQPSTSDEEKMMEDEFLHEGTYVRLENDDEASATQPCTSKHRRKDNKVKKSDDISEAMTIWASTAAERSTESTLRQQYLQRKLAKLTEKESQVKEEKNDPYSSSDDAYTTGSKTLTDPNFRKIFVKMPEHRKGSVLDRM